MRNDDSQSNASHQDGKESPASEVVDVCVKAGEMVAVVLAEEDVRKFAVEG